MSLAQKDQLLEIGSRARLGKPIICGRLSVSRDKSRPFRIMKFEQIFSLRCQTEQAESQEACRKLFSRMTFLPHLYSTPGSGGAGRDRTDDILLAKQALSQLSYGPITETCQQELVGPGRLELPTSRLSGVRSNHLSYGPFWNTPEDPSARSGERTLTRE
jgi:hypothetical protein